jgi:hypothetical protein
MRNIPILGILLSVLVGCSNEAPPDATLPSPLLTADSDRLWVLLRASRVGDGRECPEHYLRPDDARYQGLAQKCGFWTRNFTDYLRINDYPTIEYQHLQQRVYWQWYIDKRNTIQECRNTLGALPIPSPIETREEHYRLRNQCDPYDDARNNLKQTPSELRIRYK